MDKEEEGGGRGRGEPDPPNPTISGELEVGARARELANVGTGGAPCSSSCCQRPRPEADLRIGGRVVATPPAPGTGRRPPCSRLAGRRIRRGERGGDARGEGWREEWRRREEREEKARLGDPPRHRAPLSGRLLSAVRPSPATDPRPPPAVPTAPPARAEGTRLGRRQGSPGRARDLPTRACERRGAAEQSEAGVPAGASGAERAERAVDVAVRRPRLLEPHRHSLTRPRERGGKERPPGVPSENAGRPWASGSTAKRERPDPARATPDPARARPDPARASPEPAPAAGSERRQASQDLGVGEGSEGRRKRWSPATCIAPRRSAAASGRAGAGSPPRAEPGRAAASALLSRLRRAGLRRFPRLRRAGKRCPARRSGDPCRGCRVVRPASSASRRERKRRGPRQPRGRRGVSRPPRGGGCEMRVNQSGMKIRVR